MKRLKANIKILITIIVLLIVWGCRKGEKRAERRVGADTRGAVIADEFSFIGYEGQVVQEIRTIKRNEVKVIFEGGHSLTFKTSRYPIKVKQTL